MCGIYVLLLGYRLLQLQIIFATQITRCILMFIRTGFNAGLNCFKFNSR